jgi:glutamate formiminotransferase/formiminotetrahydrofolate cyclodeaminase
MNLSGRTVAGFLAALGSSEPTPGGGSASALAGAMGAALLAMVGAMPSRRAPAEADVDRLQQAGRRCATLAERLTALVDEDSAAYDAVSAAYKLPKASDQEKTRRSGRIQEALRGAIEPPLAVVHRSADAAEAAVVIARFGNPNAASDIGVAVELLGAAARGAKLNVDINLAGLKDGDAAGRLADAAAEALADCERSLDAARAALTATG